MLVAAASGFCPESSKEGRCGAPPLFYCRERLFFTLGKYFFFYYVSVITHMPLDDLADSLVYFAVNRTSRLLISFTFKHRVSEVVPELVKAPVY